MNKRKLQANISKNKIYNSAQKLFGKYGFDNTTIEDICKHAGVSKGLFYNYYSSKLDITWKAVQPLEQKYQKLAENFTPEQTACEKLCLIIRCMLESTFLNKSIFKSARINYIREIKGDKSIIFNRKRFLYNILVDIVNEGKENKQLSSEIPNEIIVMSVMRYGFGTCINLFSIGDKEEMISIINQAVEGMRLICRGFEV